MFPPPVPLRKEWGRLIALLGALALGLIVAPGLAAPPVQYQPPHTQPGPAVDRLLFKAFHQDIASASLQAGEMDFYTFGMKTEAANQLRGNPDVTIYQAPASMISLVVNPAPAPEGEFNPFSLREVRFALQYAVNRNFISQEIYKGLASPMVAHVGPFDFDYLTTYDLVKEHDLSYDPDLADELFTQAMTQAGAVLQDGRWLWDGRPIQVKFIIRTEDERRDVGDLIRAELERLGLTVVSVYHDFAAAIQKVYSTDPQLFEWHLYTEGWGRGAAERYDFSTVTQMTAPWLGNMPGWQEVGFWQYEHSQLDELSQKLFRGEFGTADERNVLYREITDLGIQESVRIWLATIVNSFPVTAALQGVTEDISSGPKSLFTLREAYVPDQDTLTVGNLWVWTERTTWNPIGGFGDVYSVDIWRNLHDPPLVSDPFTGIPQPFRADYDVTTAGPSGKLEVPADAFRWDAQAGAFGPVAAGTQATSKVTYDYSRYFQGRWHHGQPITMADVVYSIFQSFDMAYNEDKARVEFALAVTSRPYLETIRGFRLVGDDRLEVYADFWHFEDDYIASYATPAGLAMPWEVLAAMDELVFADRSAAYSSTAAQRFSVSWINLVMSGDTILVKRALREMQEEERFPENAFQVAGRSLVSREEALARYEATLAWIEEHDMAVISNGPFQLQRFDPPAQFAELVAFRDESYPFRPGDLYRGAAPSLQFTSIQALGIGIGFPATFEVQLEGPGRTEVRYLLFDPSTRETIDRGDAERGEGITFRISLSPETTSPLAPGLYHLYLTAFSDAVSSLVERRVDLEAMVGEVPKPPSGTAIAQVTPTSAGGRRGFSCSAPEPYWPPG